MSRLTRKPWNDPRSRAAERDPAYKSYCFGFRDARRMSWRRLKKASKKYHSGARIGGRLELAVCNIIHTHDTAY